MLLDSATDSALLLLLRAIKPDVVHARNDLRLEEAKHPWMLLPNSSERSSRTENHIVND